MKTPFTFSLFLILSCPFFLIAQAFPPPDGGGEYVFENAECVPSALRQSVRQMLRDNIADLRAKGMLSPTDHRNAVSLNWPLRQAEGFSYNSYYGISNYVDHDPLFSGQNNNHVEDYRCGNRSYDTGAGYNHQGTDFFIWPFQWQLMDHGQVEVVAAAAGTIIGKLDGHYDRNCAFNNMTWNAVFIQHADGSTAWYGHLKNGSLTDKAVGVPVEAGEYLGLVGSSGSSTGPHLHFEVYDSSGNLVDPYSGSCNDLNAASWWAEQLPYREPTINTIMTHQAPPVFFDCPPTPPTPENVNASNCFLQPTVIYFAAYFHDQLVNDPAQYRVFRPDGSVFSGWNHATPMTYNASWWWWARSLPLSAPSGIWRFEVTYGGETVSHSFSVGPVPFTGEIDGPEVSASAAVETYWVPNPVAGRRYEWTVEGGTILDADPEAGVMTVMWGDGPVGEVCLQESTEYGCFGSPVCLGVELSATATEDHSILPGLRVFPNPVREVLHFDLPRLERSERVQIQLFNGRGQSLYREDLGRLPVSPLHHEVDVKTLPTGIYWVELRAGQVRVLRKIAILK